jgi:hypothetical protein
MTPSEITERMRILLDICQLHVSNPAFITPTEVAKVKQTLIALSGMPDAGDKK